jgi:4-hydroxythreonine-4-phosphate dehydrogenase
MNKIIFTCGDTNGIGPEIVIKTLNKIKNREDSQYYFACPENVFDEVQNIIRPSFDFVITRSVKPSFTPGRVTIIDTGKAKINAGFPTKHSGKAAFKSVKTAFQFVHKGLADAMVTAPISKFAINTAGYNFPGHTEMLAEWCGVKKFVMMFLSEHMNSALITIHEPVKKISSLITKKLLNDRIDIIMDCLINDLQYSEPRAAVLGLNPHAGENGLIGKEEVKTIKPALIESAFTRYISGPFSPDAFFANKMYKQYDVVIGMYHDQVLIPFKMLNFSSGVNYTAGLPVIRTSPDHGTAFDIAYKGIADESSIYEAFIYAEKIANNRRLNKK